MLLNQLHLLLQLSVIIVNYNVKYFLEQCLSSLFSAVKSIDAEVWVVDNASTDSSVAYLKERFTTVNFIINNVNAGFGKANNQALQKCKGKYVLFLNPDTILPEDSLSNCIGFMEGNEQAGALGIRMINGSGIFLPESKRSFPAPLTSLYKLTGLNRLFPRSKTFSRYALAYLDEHENHEVDVLSGAFLLARREILIKLNGFDEAFFMYGEDIDLSYRIQKLGFKNYYFSESTIIHFKGKSTSKQTLTYIKMFYGAMRIFVRKHYKGTLAGFYVFFIHTAIWFRASLSAITGVILRQSKVNVKGKEKSQKEKKAIIVGTQEEFAEVQNLLNQQALKVMIAGRIAVNNHKENSLGNLKDLNSLVSSIEVDEIIFCQGYLGYKAIIEIMQKLPAGISFRFHAAGTNSMVGSD